MSFTYSNRLLTLRFLVTWRDKNIGHCRVLKSGGIIIPKEAKEKLSIRDGDFVDLICISSTVL